MQEDSFEGEAYRLADNWVSYIPVTEFSTRPIQYLEIGTFYGANLLSVAKSYASHPDSVLHCVDPWEDYEDYPEYKTQQDNIYTTFLRNIDNSEHKNRICIHRGYSHQKAACFDDQQFDVIYIDGNHEPEYVLEDAVLYFRKLKLNGYMIFDDYGWGGPHLTQKGIDAFLQGYHKRIQVKGEHHTQMFVQKIR